MNELIPIKYDAEYPSVSARALHSTLGIEKRFSAWFETNSQGFIEGEDFRAAYLEVQSNQYGGSKEVTDYELSIDMAKHICLMSRTEKGKQCRQYLIDLEKAWNTPEQVLARALKVADKIIEQKDRLIEEMKPKAEYFDELVERNLLTNFRDTAKELKISQKAFIDFLLKNKFVYYDNQEKLKPYADKNNGLFELKEYKSKYSDHVGLQTLITPKGRETFRLLLQKEKV